MSDLQKVYDSAELDLNFTADGEERAEGYACGNLATENGIQVDLKKQGQQVSASLPVDSRKENLRSSNNKSRSVPTDFDQDDAKRTKSDYDQERTQSPSSDNHYQGEMDELPGSYFHKSSFEYKAQTLHHEKGTEGSAHSQESPMTADSNQVVETECNANIDRPKTHPQDENVKETLLEKSTVELNNYPCKANEGEAFEHETRKLSSYSISTLGDDEGECENEKHRSKRNSSTESRKIYMPHSVPQSPGSRHERSTSTAREKQMLVSPEGSPHVRLSPKRRLSLHVGVPDHLHSPATCRKKHSYSPGRSQLAKRFSSHGHSSPSATQTSASPRRSRQGSRHKNGSSLKCMSASPEPRSSPKKYWKHDRTMSRSPVQRRDSTCGYRRDYRGRSRSRSPYTREHDRSPRRRYSPRRRSPSGYHSHHHSSRRRPWSPPPNRRTGVGKPGKNLFVAGFSFLTTERDLERKFSRFGRVRDVRIVRDKRSGDSRGFGFLSLDRDEDADAAIRALDETEWNGRIILVEKSKSTR